MDKGSEGTIPTFGAISSYTDGDFSFTAAELAEVADVLESEGSGFLEGDNSLSMDEFLSQQAPTIEHDGITGYGLKTDSEVGIIAKATTVKKSKTVRFTAENFDLKTMDKNDVFVFGANRAGEHGKGAAGAAMGVQRAVTTVRKLKKGTKGKFAEKGKTGYQSGTDGSSFGLITVEKLVAGKPSIKATEDVIIDQFEYLMRHADAK
jgi:hypothetical protein